MTFGAAVIGAGPAGSLAALALARAGLRVALIDKARFPREKVCGCCLSAASLDTLAAAGLGGVLTGAQELNTLNLACGGARASLPISSKSLSRSVLDYALIQAAIAEGVELFSGTPASITPDETIDLRFPDSGGGLPARPKVLAPGAILVADGLAGSALRHFPALAPRAASRSRIGLSAILAADTPGYEPHRIHMTIARAGYVGAVRLEDHRLNIAAAIDPRFIRECGSPAGAVAHILDTAGMPAAPLDGAHFIAAPTLTRRRSTVQHGRLFVLGDAASYVEPFTGEGIGWALASGAAVVPHIVAHLQGRPADWERSHRGLIAPRQRLCRTMAWALRRPILTRAAIRTLALLPALAGPALRRAASPFREAAA